ncbi:MAG: SpoIIE family protein phosphatase [Nitrososphaerales archaeon]
MDSVVPSSGIECYVATRPQQGKTSNEDATLISRGQIPCAVLCDSAGNAQQTAKRVLALFDKLLIEATHEEVLDQATWRKWVKLLDSLLLGGNQSTFVAVAIINGVAVGACTGDSRAYLLDRNGELRILSDGASKFRLGSGKAEPFPIHQKLNPGDILLLVSDGAWTPLGIYQLKKAVQSALGRHFSEVPVAILDAAGKAGRADDMTAVALRLLR